MFTLVNSTVATLPLDKLLRQAYILTYSNAQREPAMTAYSTDEDTVIEAHAKASESFDALARRLADGNDRIWDEINGAKVIRLHGEKFSIIDALVLAAFGDDDVRQCVLDDVKGELQNYLYDAAKAAYYERRAEADECAADWARDAYIDDLLTGDRT